MFHFVANLLIGDCLSGVTTCLDFEDGEIFSNCGVWFVLNAFLEISRRLIQRCKIVDAGKLADTTIQSAFWLAIRKAYMGRTQCKTYELGRCTELLVFVDFK